MLFQRETGLIVLEGPAAVADRADIDEARLDGILREGRAREADRQRSAGGEGLE